MKKTLKLTSFLLAAIVAFGMMATALAAVMGTVKLSSGTMSIRKSPTTKSASVGTLKNGAKIEITAKSGEWYKIKSGNIVGYVMQKYVTLSSSTTTTPAKTSTTSSSRTGTVTSATNLYKSASTKASILVKLPKNAKLTIVSQTASYYKATYNKKTGYVLKTKVKLNAATTTPVKSTPKPENTVIPGQAVGYTNSTISKPKDPVTNKAEMVNAINYNISNFKTNFTINVKSFNTDMIPGSTSAYEYAFINNGFKSIIPGEEKNGITPIKFNVDYTEGGVLVSHYRLKTEIPASNTRAVELKNKVDKILADQKISSKKTDYDKVVALHDYIVLNVGYDNGSKFAHNALVSGKANCQGYAEAMHVLLTAAGLENRLVWATSKIETENSKAGKPGTHGFNKVKVDGAWYNVDCTADDPNPDIKGRLRRDFLLVNDTITRQRYKWEESRYPAAKSMTLNWHYKNKRVANTQAELEKIVKDAVAKKEKQISVWMPKYSNGKYKTAFASKLSGVKSAKVTVVNAAKEYTTFATALFFTITY